jgi:hypothetical protein
MPKPATHILVDYPSKHTTLLYRAADGMSLGCKIDLNVMFGESRDPAKVETRAFLDEAYALKYLRDCADRDCVARLGEGFAASFDEREGESRLIKPNSQVVSLAN